MPVIWKPAWSVGNAELDRQHRHIIALVNAVETAASDDGGLDTIDAVLSHLVRFLENHFSSEERLMEAIAYPSLEEHRQQHRACVALLSRLTAEREIDIERVIVWLSDWLENHVLGSDQGYAAFLRDDPEAVQNWEAEGGVPEREG